MPTYVAPQMAHDEAHDDWYQPYNKPTAVQYWLRVSPPARYGHWERGYELQWQIVAASHNVLPAVVISVSANAEVCPSEQSTRFLIDKHMILQSLQILQR